ncbi:hypothetical protein B0I35DRAFT_405016 [Stachybotrys elegans]|uniref:Nephrocystin 3-like N-terminal domain-containing protein n=1 Tax=Stachybotrys elegans TaxID=80388 RepID=A0A8K0WVP5_9HYPO|nr:hypothetical protein B0I35DRAFT_405016 [Stachybotrys elegans]
MAASVFELLETVLLACIRRKDFFIAIAKQACEIQNTATQTVNINVTSIGLDDDTSVQLPLRQTQPTVHTTQALSQTGPMWIGLLQWLQSSNGLFWIQGQPRSGKSCLVKYLVDHEETQRLLNCWKPNVMILQHYLWKDGTEMQNSFSGLLRSLAYQALSQSAEEATTDAILAAFDTNAFLAAFANTPRRKYDYEWSIEDLERLLVTLLKHYPQPVCIFIDGLDELHKYDDSWKLARLIKDVSEIEHVKLCVSSRAETAFESTFRGFPTLRVQDVTVPEMIAFMKKQLEELPGNMVLSSDDAQKLIDAVLEKAEGIFQWVVVVMKDINAGIRNGIGLNGLLSLLEKYPRDFDDYYLDMWERLSGGLINDKQKAAKYLQQAILSQNSMALHTMIASNDEVRKKMLDCDTFLDRQDMQYFCKQSRLSILRNCEGFLKFACMTSECTQSHDPVDDELQFAKTHHLSFAHCTTLDFLETTKAGQEILATPRADKSQIALQVLGARVAAVRTEDKPRDLSSLLRAVWRDTDIHIQGYESQYLFYAVRRFYDAGLLHYTRKQWPSRRMSSWAIIACAAGAGKQFAEYLGEIPKEHEALQVLGDMWHQKSEYVRPVNVIRALVNRVSRQAILNGPLVTFLAAVCGGITGPQDSEDIKKTAEILLMRSTNTNHQFIFAVPLFQSGDQLERLFPSSHTDLRDLDDALRKPESPTFRIFFMLNKNFLAYYFWRFLGGDGTLSDLMDAFDKDPFCSIAFIKSTDPTTGSVTYFQPKQQKPFLDLTATLFYQIRNTESVNTGVIIQELPSILENNDISQPVTDHHVLAFMKHSGQLVYWVNTKDSWPFQVEQTSAPTDLLGSLDSMKDEMEIGDSEEASPGNFCSTDTMAEDW